MNRGGKLCYIQYQLQALLLYLTLSTPKYCHGLPVGRETNKSGSLCRKVSMYVWQAKFDRFRKSSERMGWVSNTRSVTSLFTRYFEALF